MALIFEMSGPSDSMTVIPLNSWKGMEVGLALGILEGAAPGLHADLAAALEVLGDLVVLGQRRAFLLGAGMEWNAGLEEDAGGGSARRRACRRDAATGGGSSAQGRAASGA